MCNEARIEVVLVCKSCDIELQREVFLVTGDDTLEIEITGCDACKDDAYGRGYKTGEACGSTRGYEDGYDDGFDEGSEANIEFVDDDEPTKDIE